MARPKANKQLTVEETINFKIDSLETHIEALQAELVHWRKVASDYETNRVTIESILSVHQAPDLSFAPAKTEAPVATKTKKPRGVTVKN